MSHLLHDEAPCGNKDAFALMHAVLQSSAVPLSRLLRNAREKKQCSGLCTCALGVPITFGDAPAHTSQGLLRSHSSVTLRSAHCPSLLSVTGDASKRRQNISSVRLPREVAA